MTIKPAFGNEQINLRMSASDLRTRFGAPPKRHRSGSFREYWIYSEAGFSCIVSRRTQHVLSIFFTPHSPFSDASLDDCSAAEIESEFGAPRLQGGGVPTGDGGILDRWFSYDSGIGFTFDAADRLQTISVFAPRRRVKAKAVVSSHEVRGRSIAALRRA
jgi:hypothetical protein